MSAIKSTASYSLNRIEPFTAHSRLRTTLEDADRNGNNDGNVTADEVNAIADRFERQGNTYIASDYRAAWSKVEQQGEANLLATAGGAVYRGVIGLFEAMGDKLFENVR